jgi:hypothetical protein
MFRCARGQDITSRRRRDLRHALMSSWRRGVSGNDGSFEYKTTRTAKSRGSSKFATRMRVFQERVLRIGQQREKKQNCSQLLHFFVPRVFVPLQECDADLDIDLSTKARDLRAPPLQPRLAKREPAHSSVVCPDRRRNGITAFIFSRVRVTSRLRRLRLLPGWRRLRRCGRLLPDAGGGRPAWSGQLRGFRRSARGLLCLGQ